MGKKIVVWILQVVIIVLGSVFIFSNKSKNTLNIICWVGYDEAKLIKSFE